MQNKYLKDAKTIASMIKKYFGTKVSLVTPEISDDDVPWYRVSFVLYRTFKFNYEYEKGYFSLLSASNDKSGVIIQFSDDNIRKFDNRSPDETIVMENLKILDEEVRLRLPDKFLKQF